MINPLLSQRLAFLGLLVIILSEIPHPAPAAQPPGDLFQISPTSAVGAGASVNAPALCACPPPGIPGTLFDSHSQVLSGSSAAASASAALNGSCAEGCCGDPLTSSNGVAFSSVTASVTSSTLSLTGAAFAQASALGPVGASAGAASGGSIHLTIPPSAGNVLMTYSASVTGDAQLAGSLGPPDESTAAIATAHGPGFLLSTGAGFPTSASGTVLLTPGPIFTVFGNSQVAGNLGNLAPCFDPGGRSFSASGSFSISLSFAPASASCDTDAVLFSQGGTWGCLCLASTAGLPCPTVPCLNGTLSSDGCTLTCLAMALNHAGVTIDGAPVDPANLNIFLAGTNGFNSTGGLILAAAAGLAVAAMGPPNLRWKEFDGTTTGALEERLCSDQAPVIVRVPSHCNGGGDHYVLVYAKQGDDFLIHDPAGSCGHTALGEYEEFSGRGSIVPYSGGGVADATGGIGSLVLGVGEGARILVEDASGNRTGIDGTGTTFIEIPASHSTIDAVGDDEGSGQILPQSQTVGVFQPASGPYLVTLGSSDPGVRECVLHAFAADGSHQGVVVLTAIGGPGAESSFSVQYASQGGATAQVTRTATFESALGDIQNARAAGAIHPQGPANALSSMLGATLNALGNGNSVAASNILGAFQAAVAALTPNHIDPVVSEILVQDAQSLASSIP